MSEARVRVIGNAFKLEPQVTRGRNSASGRAKRLLGAASERFAFRLVTDEPVHAVAFMPKGAWSQEQQVAMSTTRAASSTEARAVCGICLARNDGCADQVCEVEITPRCDCLFGS